MQRTTYRNSQHVPPVTRSIKVCFCDCVFLLPVAQAFPVARRPPYPIIGAVTPIASVFIVIQHFFEKVVDFSMINVLEGGLHPVHSREHGDGGNFGSQYGRWVKPVKNLVTVFRDLDKTNDISRGIILDEYVLSDKQIGLFADLPEQILGSIECDNLVELDFVKAT
jgi:hypothetical protein